MAGFRKVAVIGPGLIGGSLALAIRSRNSEVECAIWARRQEVVDYILEKRITSQVSSDLGAIVKGADLVILATPVGVMPTLAQEMLPFLKSDALVTDVGSVKGRVVDQLTPLFAKKGVFVGSHPMAGGDQTGIEYAREDLFEKAACIVTPLLDTNRSAVDKITLFWMGLGCRVFELSPEAHDRAVAFISHLPHLTAAALVNTAAVLKESDVLNLIGTGFRDTTRVAMGSPEMWSEILLENRTAMLEAIEVLRKQLETVEKSLKEEQDLISFLDSAQTLRNKVARHQ